MSSLITRPTPGPTAADAPAPGRPIAFTAALAGLAAPVIGLAVCMSVALTGWFLADAGAHGNTTDALGVGAVAWLVGHGAHVVLSGTPIGMTPLAVTMILVLTAFRAGRWAARSSETASSEARTSGAASGAAPEAGADRVLAGAVASFTGAYVVVAVVVGVLASRSAADPSLGRAVLGALLVAGLSGGSGLAVGSGRLGAWLDRAPAWAGDVLTGALAGLLWLLGAGAVLVAVSLLVSFNEAANVLSGLHLSAGDAVSYLVVMALFAPNAVLLGVSYLAGPGFAFGTGTTVSSTAVSLGVVPAFPLLAALPDDGPTPGWLRLLIAVPALAAAIGVGTVLRGRPPVAHDLAALRGAAAGFLAGVLTTLLVSLAGGPLGDGRMADVGAPVAEVLVFTTGLMSVGGLLGAVLVNAWRRRGEREWTPESRPESRPEPVGAGEPAATPPPPADGDEPTVEVLR